VLGYQDFRGPCFFHLQGEVKWNHPEDRVSMDIWNVRILPQHYTAP